MGKVEEEGHLDRRKKSVVETKDGVAAKGEIRPEKSTTAEVGSQENAHSFFHPPRRWGPAGPIPAEASGDQTRTLIASDSPRAFGQQPASRGGSGCSVWVASRVE
ncbi:unnamed protein product [Lampetra fluviatilis]